MSTDTDRINYLEELIGNCPDLEIYWNDDDSMEDADGLMPVGFTMRLGSTCAPMVKVSEDSFRECIDRFRAAMRKAQTEES